MARAYIKLAHASSDSVVRQSSWRIGLRILCISVISLSPPTSRLLTHSLSHFLFICFTTLASYLSCLLLLANGRHILPACNTETVIINGLAARRNVHCYTLCCVRSVIAVRGPKCVRAWTRPVPRISSICLLSPVSRLRRGFPSEVKMKCTTFTVITLLLGTFEFTLSVNFPFLVFPVRISLIVSYNSDL